MFAVCLLALCLTVVFVACDDNTGGGGGDDKGTFYSIQAPAASDVYTVSGLPEGAYEGDTVTFTVALTNPADSSILGVTVEPAFDSSFDLTETSDGFYSFIMPADDVTVVIDAKRTKPCFRTAAFRSVRTTRPPSPSTAATTRSGEVPTEPTL